MCGITGFFDLRGAIDVDAATARVRRMADTLAHRGPDDADVWIDQQAGLALGHRRLSIIDLSPLGRQPMVSADGRYVITYNGEVYNFPALRAQLEALGHQFRGGSDTEVMLAAFQAWGPEPAIERFVGMFAFALWDRQERSLRLVRDRLGVKPLFWSLRNRLLLFGSELKALMAHPEWHGEVDREAVAAFLRHSYVPGPATIFGGVYKLGPGSILTIDGRGEPALRSYWTLHDAVEQAIKAPPIRDEEAVDRLDTVLRDAVRARMIADVPLGAFLSGGIDSSTVVALMQAQSNRQVRTFSIGFHDQQYDEAHHAGAVARHLGTDHTELYVSPDDALDLVPRLPDWFDEPFADSSQLPTYLVAKMTRGHVTVALSGDGGDELFAGYPRYWLTAMLWRRIGAVPAPIRRGLGQALRRMPYRLLDQLAGVIPRRMRPLNPGQKIHRMASALGGPSADHVHADLSAVWPDAAALVPGTTGLRDVAPASDIPSALTDPVARMQYHDTITYLPDDILQKVDRCSMAVSLEAREPLLDHRLVEFVWSLPANCKLRNGESKWLLRCVLDRYVPRELVERPKMGFSVPLGAWLRGPLREWGEALLAPARLRSEGVLATEAVRGLWHEHQSGRADRDVVLWNLLMFQAWQERYRAL